MFGWFKKKSPAQDPQAQKPQAADIEASGNCEAVCTKWNAERGFGFVSRGEGTKRIFVHKSYLPKGISKLEEGTRVNVEVVSVEKGLRAEKVTLL